MDFCGPGGSWSLGLPKDFDDRLGGNVLKGSIETLSVDLVRGRDDVRGK